MTLLLFGMGMALVLTTLLQGRHHIMVDLYRMDHETQKARRVLSWIHRRYSMLLFAKEKKRKWHQK